MSPKFPKKCRQRKKGGDLLFICVPDGNGKYSHHYYGKWEDLSAHQSYERDKRDFESGIDRLDSSGLFCLRDLVERFLSWASVYYRKNGKETAEPRSLALSLRDLVERFGDLPVCRFGVKQLREYQQVMDVQGSLCRKTVNKRINHVRRLLRWGAENELVPLDVVTSVSLLRPLRLGRCLSEDRPKVQSVPLEDVERTLPYLSSVIADMVRLQLLSACRPEEVRIMRPCDITRTSSDLWHYIPWHDKTEHTRRPEDKKVIPLGTNAIRILQERLSDLPDDSDEYIFRPSDALAERKERLRSERKSKLTPSQLRRDAKRKRSPKMRVADHYSSDSYRRAVERAAAKAGVEKWTPYQLRHTSATEIERKFGWRAAQMVLGHKSPDTTRIYIDHNISEAEDIMRKIG